MLLCDRCKKPIVGESKKLLDVCPECYDQVMNYITAGNTNIGVNQAKVIARIGRKFYSKVAAIVVILIILFSLASYFAYYSYSQYEAPFQTEKQLAVALEQNLTQEQDTLQTAANLILKYRATNTNLTGQIDMLNQNLTNANNNITALHGVISFLKSQASSLQNNVSQLQGNIAALKNRSNTFVIWNVPVNVSSGFFLFETVPDTFDYHDNFTSSGPVAVYYFNSSQFVQWYTTRSPVGNFTHYVYTEKQSDTFTLAEGCGGYVAIYYFPSGGIIHPNISATYDPAAHPTGSCS